MSYQPASRGTSSQLVGNPLPCSMRHSWCSNLVNLKKMVPTLWKLVQSVVCLCVRACAKPKHVCLCALVVANTGQECTVPVRSHHNHHRLVLQQYSGITCSCGKYCSGGEVNTVH